MSEDITEVPFRRILCPIDFSPLSRAALQWSCRFADRLGAKTTVLHALDTRQLTMGSFLASPGAFDALRENAEAEMDSWKRELRLTTSDLQIREGVPEQLILEAAEGGGVDLVVMGTHGYSGFHKLFLGSLTERILHQVSSPMLALTREAAETYPDRLETILAAIDFGPETPDLVRWAITLGRRFDAAVVFVHAVSVPYTVLNERTLAPLSEVELRGIEDRLLREPLHDLGELVPEVLREERVRSEARIGAPLEVLSDMKEEIGAGLVLLGAGGHGGSGLGWVGSTCHKFVRTSDRPVLVVR